MECIAACDTRIKRIRIKIKIGIRIKIKIGIMIRIKFGFPLCPRYSKGPHNDPDPNPNPNPNLVSEVS